MSVSSKNHNFERTKSVTMSAFNCSAGLAVVVVDLDVAVAEIVLRSWEDLSDERCAVCTGTLCCLHWTVSFEIGCAEQGRHFQAAH